MEIIESRTAFSGPEVTLPELVQVPTVYDPPVPPFNNLLIKANAAAATFEGTNFVIPDSAKQKVDRGVVVAAAKRFITGGVSFDMAEEVKTGDIVTFNVYSATPKIINGEEYQLVSIFDINLVERVSYAPLG